MMRTFKNEGNWEPETAKGAKLDTGNYYGGKYYGTNWGVTALFLVDYNKILNIELTPSVIKDLTKEKAAWIFEVTEGAHMRYNEMKDQFIADFIFDWMIHRPGTCVAYMCRDIFGLPAGSGTKAGVFTDALVKRINSSDPAGLYNSLKFWRLHHLTYTNTYKSFRPGIFNRITSFKDYPDNEIVTKMIAEAKKVAFS
jgi:lysozyme family protein